MIIEMPKKRKYVLRRRAERQQATRDRIVKATVALHEELGPRATTISAIAERAGVQRLTVYRHFPDDTSLFVACSSSYLEENPTPEPEQWQSAKDPAARTRAALEALYGYFRKTARMWTRVYLDYNDVPALQKPMADFDAYLDGIRQDLIRAWEASQGSAGEGMQEVLGHALRFSTWQSLSEEGLDDAAMARLVVRWATSIGKAPAPG